MMIKRFDYRHYICIAITIIFLLLSLCFLPSFKRIYESVIDLGLSIGYYFLELIFITDKINPTINNISSTSNIISNNFSLFDFESFSAVFDLSLRSITNFDSFRNYLLKLLQILCNVARYLLLLLPLFILLKVKFNSYFSFNDKNDNEDSIQLKCFYKFKNKIINPIINWIHNFCGFLSYYKFYKIIWIVIWCIYFNIFTIIIEFFAYYLYFSISFNVPTIFVQLYKLLIDLLPMIKTVPFPIWIIIICYVFHHLRLKIGYQYLRHFENRNKGFINSLGQVTMICSPMGKGKTTTLTDMALSQEVIFRTKAFEKLYEQEKKFPHFPFILFERKIKLYMEKHYIYNLATCRKWIRSLKRKYTNEYGELICDYSKIYDYNYNLYGQYYGDGLKREHLLDVLELYVQFYFIYVIESSLLVSNYGIRQSDILDNQGHFPLWSNDFFNNSNYNELVKKNAHILDFDMLRLGKKIIEDNKKSNALEFGVIVITECGKERGNQLDTREMKKNDDVANQLNDGFNKWLKLCRHSATVDNFPFIKIFMDDQRPESLGADARELSEKIIFIEKKDDIKNTLMLFNLETIIYDYLSNKFFDIYYRYRYYRSDNTLLFHFLKMIVSKYNRYYVNLYNTFGYYRITLQSEKGTLDNKFEDNHYYLMPYKIYSKRFATDCFSEFFVDKALKSKIGIDDLETFETEKASLEELQSENSYFINDISKIKE